MKITYNPNGVKLCQYASNNTSFKKYDYVGTFVYNNGLLSYIISSEGRAVFNNNKLNYFEYHIKDHLGNVRVVFQKLKSGNSYYANVVQKNDYYPFGMLIGSTYQANTTSKNKYLYNGKELISEYDIELNWYDYGARMYDAQVGRWNSVDPLAENSRRWSPYSYCYNNPLRFIDPDGMQAGAPKEKKLEELQKAATGKTVQEKTENIVKEFEKGDYVSGETFATIAGISGKEEGGENKKGDASITPEQKEAITSIDKVVKYDEGFKVNLKEDKKEVTVKVPIMSLDKKTNEYKGGNVFRFES